MGVSIKLRTIILRRGLADRSNAVVDECLKLMKDEWLLKSCSGDPIELLKYLDVETYELVGESVMGALLQADLAKIQESGSIKQYIASNNDTSEGWYIFTLVRQPCFTKLINFLDAFVVAGGKH